MISDNKLKKKVVLSILGIILMVSLAFADMSYSNPNLPKLNAPPVNNGSNATVNVNNSQFLRGYTPFNLPYVSTEVDPVFSLWLSTFLYNYNQTQPAIDYTNNYSYPLNSNPNNYINSSSGLNGTFVPYNNATGNVNLQPYNITANALVISMQNNSYLLYNQNTGRIELWANGILQQDWGHSTTIYGVATFQSNAFFQNLSGSDLLISANVDINGSLRVEQNATIDKVFANNICYSNGTNCNVTFVNGTNGMNGLNGTNGVNGTNGLNGTNGVNGTNGINGTFTGILNTTQFFNVSQIFSINESWLNLAVSSFGFIKSWLVPNISNGYLSNTSSQIFFNDTFLNQTITQIANVNAFSQEINITVSGGIGNATSSLINYYLTELIVIPQTNTTTFNFQATQNNATGFIIDKNRITHNGTWDIYKQYSLSNDTVFLSITNASTSGNYQIKIKYINSKFTYP